LWLLCALYLLLRALAVSNGGDDHGTWPLHQGVPLLCVELDSDEDDDVSSLLSARSGTLAGLGRGVGVASWATAGLVMGCW
jgi:hypothetical protein